MRITEHHDVYPIERDEARLFPTASFAHCCQVSRCKHGLLGSRLAAARGASASQFLLAEATATLPYTRVPLLTCVHHRPLYHKVQQAQDFSVHSLAATCAEKEFWEGIGYVKTMHIRISVKGTCQVVYDTGRQGSLTKSASEVVVLLRICQKFGRLHKSGAKARDDGETHEILHQVLSLSDMLWSKAGG